MINNSKLKTQNSKLGFTMIELLAVAVVIIAVTSIISEILFSSLRGVSKTSVTDAVRQNGNSAIAKVSREIKFAKTFLGIDDDDIEPYKTDCSTYGIVPTPTPAPYDFLKIKNLDNEEIKFYCADSLYQKIGTSPQVSLFDTSAVTMDQASCYFTCTQNVSTDPPTIGIHFTLSQKDAQSSFFEQKATLEFQTSATFRNLNK